MLAITRRATGLCLLLVMSACSEELRPSPTAPTAPTVPSPRRTYVHALGRGTAFEIPSNGRQPVRNVLVGWTAPRAAEVDDFFMAETRTDAQGHYRLCGLPRERITLYSAPAYGNGFLASIDSGSDAVVDIELARQIQLGDVRISSRRAPQRRIELRAGKPSRASRKWILLAGYIATSDSGQTGASASWVRAQGFHIAEDQAFVECRPRRGGVYSCSF